MKLPLRNNRRSRRGNALVEQVLAGACGLKDHEDWGTTPAVIDCIAQTKTQARAELASLPGATPDWIEERLSALAE